MIGRVSVTEMLTGVKGGALEKYLGVQSLKPSVDIDLVLEKMVAFRMPEVEGLEKEVKGLRSDALIDVCRGFVAGLEADNAANLTTKLTSRPFGSRPPGRLDSCLTIVSELFRGYLVAYNIQSNKCAQHKQRYRT